MKITNNHQWHLPSNAIAVSRAMIEQEFSSIRAGQPHVLQLALNEAEALAWQTGFPELVFPALAQEKARKVADWVKHQECIREAGRIEACAA